MLHLSVVALLFKITKKTILTTNYVYVLFVIMFFGQQLIFSVRLTSLALHITISRIAVENFSQQFLLL